MKILSDRKSGINFKDNQYIASGKELLSDMRAESTDNTSDRDMNASERGSRMNRTCAPMCVIGCLNRHTSKEGRAYQSPSQVETQAAIQSCYGIDDYDLAHDVQELATEIGIVATEFITASKSFAAAQKIDHGENHLIEWLHEIEKGTLTGRVIASRTQGVASLYKDTDLRQWLDRDAADDEEKFTVRMDRQYRGLEDASDLDLLYSQIFVLENLGLCIFTSFALLDNKEAFDILAKMFSARTGTDISSEELILQAGECIRGERKYSFDRWAAAQKSNIPMFTKVLYRYFDSEE